MLTLYPAAILLLAQARAPAIPLRAPLTGVDVPLVLLPGDPSLGYSAGVSFLDYDADGWVDVYTNDAFLGGQLRRNVEGLAFPVVANPDVFLPQLPPIRYGAACADYDNDGLPDIALETRFGCFYLLKNLDGAGNFLEVGSDPEIVLDPPSCSLACETFCWADVDEDGDLDLFAPAYPDSEVAGSGGNHFFENLGPSGPSSSYRLARRTAQSGLEIPVGNARPEGAQFADVDRDGDPDLYSNGTLYQNVTAGAGPRFRALSEDETGITRAAVRDEGALFFDFDMDGDWDLLVVHYEASSDDIYENRGDGTFRLAPDVFTVRHSATVGCSAADWDLDGDMDLTTTNAFWRNRLVERGQRRLAIASHAIPSQYLQGMSPAWCDWDRDGDLDCAITTFFFGGALFRNTTYDAGTPLLQKLALRVRPVVDSPTVARGLETAFGASVEVRVLGDEPGRVRRQFTASSHGYLQQSEYALTFGLPPGPDAAAPARGVVFDLLVDFPSRSEHGILRVDRNVNSILGGLELASLAEREITVFQSGLVRIDGIDHPPTGLFSPRMGSTGRLALAGAGSALPELAPVPAPSWFVGLELDTTAATGPTRVEELVLDGVLETTSNARCGSNVWLWDVTPDAAPFPVFQEELTTPTHNVRSFLALSWTLKPGRVYRVLCRVTSARPSPPTLVPGALVHNRGGLSFANGSPCSASAILGAPLFADRAFVELRYHAARQTSFVGLRR